MTELFIHFFSNETNYILNSIMQQINKTPKINRNIYLFVQINKENNF